ncbi:translocation and assembly module lipoprotein TamL [Litoribacter populi]|uniref:translocation and assembly module lipoprotein TamL n=1 Tax=Litoribacter populi TaxID=2598460 RepID=UPI00117CEFD3|nr:BamA/TamA family outer membrane protein [Litoribacter populi]
MNRRLLFYIAFFTFFLLEACNVKKFIPEGEYLYTGSEIEFVREGEVKDFNQVTGRLNSLLPEPNSTVLGQRIGLWAHYKGSQEKPGFINRFLKNRLGEEPVYLSDISATRTEQLLVNRMENMGYFFGRTSSEVIRKDKFAEVEFKAYLPTPYLIGGVQIDRDSLPIEKEMKELLEESDLKPGDRFDLQKLQAERIRIDNELKTRGYYNFNSDYLIFEADSTGEGKKQMDLYLRLKNEAPERGIIPYRINEIKVFPNYSVLEDGDLLDTTIVKDKQYIQGNKVFKPHLLDEYILIQPGDIYNSTQSRLTRNRLSGIGNYRYVNVRFSEQDTLMDDGFGTLDGNIYLSPVTKRALRAELQGLSKSNNFAGPGLQVSLQNRNLWNGGETLNLSAKIAYETQIAAGERQGLNSLELGLKADLIFPRVIFPIPINERFAYSVPKTKMSLGVEYLNRGDLYRLFSYMASYGYYWNQNRYVYHEINPISLSFVNMTNASPEFEAILDSNPFLRNSFEQQFIAGINYTFNYNQMVDAHRTHSIFVGTTIDIAGNGLNLASRALGGDPSTFFGLNYAQYARGDVDFRYYWKIDQNNTIATRLFGGLGIPYGNSVSLPFVKQYFAGGPNSIRAFRIRSLGPGTYRPEQFDIGSFFDQAGDIRLEGNIEYRFPIISVLKGAVFMDAGNIWLQNENQALPGGAFSSEWYKELAVGAGFGVRIDIEFFVIRFDIATPLRRPYLPENERWSNSFDLGNSEWRRENLIFNFAIGYPF